MRQGATLAGLLILLSPVIAAGADAIETVTVIGVTALPGTSMDLDKIPSNSVSLSSAEISGGKAAGLAEGLNDRLASVSINDNLDDPFQPDILYRGFEASPVLGTPQGLAVYQSGVRINEAFGDAVNWDLFPLIAVARVDLLGSNPVYGLNALGGAVVVTMKNGFTTEGGDAELSGGSFGRRSLSFEQGYHDDGLGAYIAGLALDEDGWRKFSNNSIRQLYSALSARRDALSLDLSFTAADNHLLSAGATPVQELAVSRSLVFTTPQDNVNQLEFVVLNATYQASDTASLQSAGYYRSYRQTVANGNTTSYIACTAAAGELCQSDGVTKLTSPSGASLPDISRGGSLPIGENDAESIYTVSLGGSLQATSTAPVLGHENHFSLGGTVDHAQTDFQSATELGTINQRLQVAASGLYVDTPENTQFNATPVSLAAGNSDFAAYFTDSFDVTPDFTVTASGRYNVALITLHDRLGSDLNGASRYDRFNPALGVTEKITPNITLYAGFAEANRVPTASEIECSNPQIPCLLPSSLASDPPTLKQVVSRSFEAGLRGRLSLVGDGDGGLVWNAGLFRTELRDDIYGVATSLSTGYFQNIGGTRRQGAEIGVTYRDTGWVAYANYSLVDATFRSGFTLSSPANPFQDTNGDITVRRGDRLPGIPRHRLKAGIDYHPSEAWLVGAGATVVSANYYRGDESNQLAPLPGYAVLTLHAAWSLNPQIELFAHLDNALDARYATFGVLGDPTGIGTPGVPPTAVTSGAGVDNRFQSPAAPIAVYGGLRLRF
jgi:iron complex outermembrane receptor protein